MKNTKGSFTTPSNIEDGSIWEKSEKLFAINLLLQKAQS